MIYQPPPEEIRKIEKASLEDVNVERYQDISYCSYSNSNESLYILPKPLNPSIPRVFVRILHFHGANDDISTCYKNIVTFVDTLLTWFHIPVYIKCWIIDYPGYGISTPFPAALELLGQETLDIQIASFWEMLLSETPVVSPQIGEITHTHNILWSFSIGTHYAARLLRLTATIDHCLFTAPFYTIADSCNRMGSSFYDAEEGQGMCILPLAFKDKKPIVLAYLGKLDDVFPSSIVLPQIRARLHAWIEDSTANHQWFLSLVGVQVVASFIGMQLGKFYVDDSVSDSDVGASD